MKRMRAKSLNENQVTYFKLMNDESSLRRKNPTKQKVLSHRKDLYYYLKNYKIIITKDVPRYWYLCWSKF